MTGLPLFLLVALVMLLVVIHLAGRRYRALLRNEHLLEIAEGLGRIRGEAAAAPPGKPAEPRPGETPPGTLRTSGGYVLVYAMAPEPEGVVHRLAFTHRGRGFAVTAAAFLASFVSALLGLGEGETVLAVSRTGRYHLAWTLDGEDQRRFLAREIEVPDRDRLAVLVPDCWRRARALRRRVLSLESLEASSS